MGRLSISLPPPVELGIPSSPYNMSQFSSVPNPGQWPAKSFGAAFRSNSKSSSAANAPSIITDNRHENYPDPDMELISGLIEHISQNPSAVEARGILMQQYNACGWFSGAKEVAEDILKLDPFNWEANSCLDFDLGANAGSVEANARGGNHKQMNGKVPMGKIRTSWKPRVFPISSPSSALRELEEGYTVLLKRAKILHEQSKLWHGLKNISSEGSEMHALDIATLAQGKVSHVLRTEPVTSVKDVAKAMTTESEKRGRSGFDIAYEDLEGVVKKLSRKSGEARTLLDDNYDTLRDALIKRARSLKALVPEGVKMLVDRALMHAEHELLHRSYVNTETMFGDAVSDILRENFWASEDGYAWDMNELAQAITSNGGVMRNPLSKVMFTPADVHDIVHHPLGKRLAALQIDQSKLKRGLRPTTIDEIAKLAKVLLEDMTADQVPSRRAIDEFAAYLATLPRTEQQAIDSLKVPARDSHTGNGYDWTIGEAVRDAQGNRVCTHKTGDFLHQAANYLRKQRGTSIECP